MRIRYFKDNIKLLKFINNEKYLIESVKVIKKHCLNSIFEKTYISSYCVKYKKVL